MINKVLIGIFVVILAILMIAYYILLGATDRMLDRMFIDMEALKNRLDQVDKSNTELEQKTQKILDEIKNKDLGILRLSGKASYYDYVLSSGWSSKGKLVCATRDYKRYSNVKVTNTGNGTSVICRVTDFGPNKSIFPERIVDLSSEAFSRIAPLSLGVINVMVESVN